MQHQQHKNKRITMKHSWRQVIAYTCLFALALQSTPIAQAVTLKERMSSAAGSIGSALQSASTTAKTKLREASSQVAHLDRAALFASVSNKLESAGVRIRRISNCIASGKECNSTDRVILIGTASFIFVTLMVLAGSALTVAARADLIEKAKQQEAQKAKSSSPKALVNRLGTMIQSGKGRFQSLKAGIISGKLTRSERNFLIGFGTSIIGATLVTAAVLAGLAIYSKKQEETKGRETAPELTGGQQQEAPAQPFPAEPSSTSPLNRLKELAQSVDTSIKESLSPMQQYFKDNIVPDSNSILATSANEVKKLLVEKTQLAKTAISTGVVAEKERLAALAQQKLDQAKALAQKITAQIEANSPQFINDALEKLFRIKLDYIQPIIDKITNFMSRSIRAWEPIRQIRLMSQLTALTEKFNTFVRLTGALNTQKSATLRGLTARKTWIRSHVRPVRLGGKTAEQLQEEANIHYPLAAQWDSVWDTYRTLMEGTNELKISGPGIILRTYLKLVASILESVASLNNATGLIGKAVISSRLANSLRAVQKEIITIGDDIKQAATTRPLLIEFPRSTGEALLEALKGYTVRVGPGLNKQLMGLITNVTTAYRTELMPLIEDVKREQAVLSTTFKAIPSNIATAFKAQLTEKPLATIAESPAILTRLIGQNVSTLKKQINTAIKKSTQALSVSTQLIKGIPPIITLINTAMGGQMVNSEIVNRLQTVGESLERLAGELTEVDQGVEQSLDIVPASGAQ